MWHRLSESSVQCGSRVPRCRVGMPPSAAETLRAWLLSALVVHGAVAGNPDAKRLYDDLLSNYNKLVRPVVNTSDVLRVCIKLKLSQLIDVVRLSCWFVNTLWMDRCGTIRSVFIWIKGLNVWIIGLINEGRMIGMRDKLYGIFMLGGYFLNKN